MHAYCMAAAFRRRATPAGRELAKQLEFRAQPIVEMIAAPAVTLCEIDQLAADVGRSCNAQAPAPARHLVAMIASRGRRLALCQGSCISGSQNRAGRGGTSRWAPP